MTPKQLLDAAIKLSERVPDYKLVKNNVGNLAIMRDWIYIGYVDLMNGEVAIFEDED